MESADLFMPSFSNDLTFFYNDGSYHRVWIGPSGSSPGNPDCPFHKFSFQMPSSPLSFSVLKGTFYDKKKNRSQIIFRICSLFLCQFSIIKLYTARFQGSSLFHSNTISYGIKKSWNYK